MQQLLLFPFDLVQMIVCTQKIDDLIRHMYVTYVCNILCDNFFSDDTKIIKEPYQVNFDNWNEVSPVLSEQEGACRRRLCGLWRGLQWSLVLFVNLVFFFIWIFLNGL